MIRGALAAIIVLVTGSVATADTIRIATFNAELTRDGPGLLLRDLSRGQDPQIAAVVDVISTVRPDILALQGFDYDYGLQALNAFNQTLAQGGMPYAYLFAGPTNRGEQTGLDLDGDGRSGAPADAQGFGRFYGQGAMALFGE